MDDMLSKRKAEPYFTRAAKRRRRNKNVPTASFFTSAKEVLEDYDATITALKQGVDVLKHTHTADPIYDYAALMTQAYNRIYPIMLAAMVSPIKEVRDTCNAIEDRWAEDVTRVTTCHQLYKMVRDKVVDSEEEKKLKSSFMTHMKHSGAHFRSKRRRDQIRNIRKEISRLETLFNKNINENTECFYHGTNDLAGCSQEFLTRTMEFTGIHKITLKTPDVSQIMGFCSIPNTRKHIYEANLNKCGVENSHVFQKLREKRMSLARTMGCFTYSEHAVSDTMAGTTQNVTDFLDKLMKTLKPVSDMEIKHLRRLKLAEEGVDTLEPWDYAYYMEKYRQTNFSVDQNKIKEYFPTEICYPKIMEFYEDILGLRFEEVPLTDDKKWHDSVRYFATYDTKTNEVIGYFYLDMYPRDGKYSHACCSSMRSGSIDGIPIGLLIMNCDSKMDFYTVETFFHEFGHVMHQICSGYLCKYNELDWESVTTDFVEGPSQMMENWCYEPDVIARISSHYKTGATMPRDMVEKMASVRKVGQAYQWLRVSIDALTDIMAHDNPYMPISKWQKNRMKLQKTWTGMCEPPGSKYFASWSHMGCSSYASKYWSYVWAKAIAADLYTPFKKHGVTSPRIGKNYRDLILAPGGSENETTMIHNFLDRDFDTDALVEDVTY